MTETRALVFRYIPTSKRGKSQALALVSRPGSSLDFRWLIKTTTNFDSWALNIFGVSFDSVQLHIAGSVSVQYFYSRGTEEGWKGVSRRPHLTSRRQGRVCLLESRFGSIHVFYGYEETHQGRSYLITATCRKITVSH